LTALDGYTRVSFRTLDSNAGERTLSWFGLRLHLLLPFVPKHVFLDPALREVSFGFSPLRLTMDSSAYQPATQLPEACLVSMLNLTVDRVKAVVILQEGSVRGQKTHPSHSQIRNQLVDRMPKALASLSVRETKATTL
jgi:hypothetical protein